MVCSSTFWKQKCENLKTISLTVFKLQSAFRPTLSLARGSNRQFYCTGAIIYKARQFICFVSVERQTFLAFEMTSNSRDTSPLSLITLCGPVTMANLPLIINQTFISTPHRHSTTVSLETNPLIRPFVLRNWLHLNSKVVLVLKSKGFLMCFWAWCWGLVRVTVYLTLCKTAELDKLCRQYLQ